LPQKPTTGEKRKNRAVEKARFHGYDGKSIIRLSEESDEKGAGGNRLVLRGAGLSAGPAKQTVTGTNSMALSEAGTLEKKDSNWQRQFSRKPDAETPPDKIAVRGKKGRTT